MGEEMIFPLIAAIVVALFAIVLWEYWLSGVVFDFICGINENAIGCS
ncbi:hypothetical protein [Natrinema versiforme]|nr:hypothetical protein [Natrinema versiforme]